MSAPAWEALKTAVGSALGELRGAGRPMTAGMLARAFEGYIAERAGGCDNCLGAAQLMAALAADNRTALDQWEGWMGKAKALEADARLTRILRDVAAWAEETFGASTPESRAKHILKEAHELVGNPTSAEEMADIVMIVGHLAEACGVDLAEAIAAKLAVVRARRWGEPDADGVVEHVREAE